MASSLSRFLFGEKGRTQQVPTLSPGQQQTQQLLQQILSGLGGEQGGFQSALQLLQQQLDPEFAAGGGAFGDIARQQFEQQTIPNIAERFAGAGALGSSGFGQALGAGAAGLETQLAGLGQETQQNALSQLLNLFGGLSQQTLGTPEFAIGQRAPQPGFLQGILGGGARGFLGGR